MTITQVAVPIAPTAEKLRSTLLDVASDGGQYAWLEPNELWQTWNCLVFEGSPEFCAPNTKDLDQQAGWVDGFRFGVYGGVTCRTIGNDADEQNEGAKAAFLKGESTGVERALMSTRFVANAVGAGIPGDWDAPVDLTPAGGAVRPQVGVALLEEYAGSVYVGAPTLHIPRGIANSLITVGGAEFEGDVLRSATGSKVAAGAGYAYPNTGPAGTEPAATERWLYATGEVWIAKGEVQAHTSVDTENNDIVTLVERPYIAAVDCFAAAIRVTLEA